MYLSRRFQGIYVHIEHVNVDIEDTNVAIEVGVCVRQSARKFQPLVSVTLAL